MTKPSGKQLLSIVSPIYNEQGNIQLFVDEVTKVVSKLNADYEIVLVNDGSKDNSLPLLYKLADADQHFKIINLSRNFGHQVAITAGIAYAKGDAVVILDSDLQDPPKVIAQLYDKWMDGYEVINAMRKSRQDSFLKSLTASIFYKFLNMLIENKIPENVGDFRLLDRKVVNVINKLPEKDRYLRGLSTWVGFEQAFVQFDREKRHSGKTAYTLSKMFGLALNAIFSFSKLPTKLALVVTSTYIFISLAVIIYAILSQFYGHTVPGWTSEVLIFALFSSIQTLVLAVISEYVGRIYTQVQGRPLYIVSNTVNLGD